MLQPNPNFFSQIFHLTNKQANKELEVDFNNVRVSHNFIPKYLGITLDRTLTFNIGIEKREDKVRSQVNII